METFATSPGGRIVPVPEGGSQPALSRVAVRTKIGSSEANGSVQQSVREESKC